MTRPFGYVRKLPSGKHHASYIGPDRQRHNAPNTFRRDPISIFSQREFGDRSLFGKGGPVFWPSELGAH